MKNTDYVTLTRLDFGKKGDNGAGVLPPGSPVPSDINESQLKQLVLTEAVVDKKAFDRIKARTEDFIEEGKTPLSAYKQARAEIMPSYRARAAETMNELRDEGTLPSLEQSFESAFVPDFARSSKDAESKNAQTSAPFDSGFASRRSAGQGDQVNITGDRQVQSRNLSNVQSKATEQRTRARNADESAEQEALKAQRSSKKADEAGADSPQGANAEDSSAKGSTNEPKG